MRVIALLTVLTVVSSGCESNLVPGADAGAGGGTGGGGAQGGGAQACTTPQVGEMPMRRLRRLEYENTIDALFPSLTGTSYASAFPPEERSFGFDNQANQSVTQLHLEKWMEAAERISDELNLTATIGCRPTGAAEEDACATTFIDTFGARAFRRPLTTSERAAFFALFTDLRAAENFAVGMRVVIQAFLQSLPFMYRIEASAGPETAGQTAPLTDWELASRLSYFFWNEPPDAQLIAAAQAGQLQTAEQLEAQARRLLADPKARAMVDDFHSQWFDLEQMTLTFKTSAVPMENRLFNVVKHQLVDETKGLMGEVFFTGRAPQLFSLTHTQLTTPLATFYGVPPPTMPGERRELDPMQRRGILSRGAFLAIKAKPTKTSPLHRGLFIRERLLCTSMPAPPPGIPALGDALPNQTNRQLFAAHSANATCNGCHRLMEPLGFGFENYDFMGRWQTTEAGQAIDVSGEVIGAGEIDGPFVGAAALSSKLETSAQVRECLVRQWFRFSLGRGELPEDECTRSALNARFQETGGDFQDLLITLTRSDAFRRRQTIAP